MSGGPRNLTESLLPLLSMYALIGHGVFRFPADKQRPALGAIYATIVATLYLVALGFTLEFIPNEPWYGDDERTMLFIVYVNVAITVCCCTPSWRNAERFARILRDTTKVDETLGELGAVFDYARCRERGWALILAWIIVIVVCNTMDSPWLYGIVPAGQIVLITTIIHHPLHTNSIIVFNFFMSVRLVGARYREANRILEGLNESVFQNEIYAWEDERTERPAGRVFAALSSGTRHNLRTNRSRKSVIQIVKHVHLELGKIGKSLNEAYGIQMALETAALFVIFTGLLYELFVLTSNRSTYDVRPLRIIVILVWIFIYLVKLVSVNETCEKVCTEAQRTGEIIHRLDESNTGDSELPSEISQFSLQLLHDPLAFSPVGLIALGREFVRNFMTSVTTYLVILVQMTPSNTHAQGKEWYRPL